MPDKIGLRSSSGSGNETPPLPDPNLAAYQQQLASAQEAVSHCQSLCKALGDVSSHQTQAESLAVARVKEAQLISESLIAVAQALLAQTLGSRMKPL